MAIFEFLNQSVLPLLQRFNYQDVLLILTNLILLMVARPLLSGLSHSSVSYSDTTSKLTLVSLFRSVNLLSIGLIVIFRSVLAEPSESWVVRLLGSVLIIYLAYLVYHILSYFTQMRFGKFTELGGKNKFTATYNSRAIQLLLGIGLFSITLLALIQLFGLQGLLEAGGVLGFVGVLLALTQASWAPDLISGLIILNSKLFEEGQVIEIEDGNRRLIAQVFRTKMFHTEILDLVNNHRIALPNKKLRSSILHNLSKFASARGYRDFLTFDIGYDVPSAEVEKLFKSAFEAALRHNDAKGSGVSIEAGHGFSTKVLETGNDAVKWGFYYYTKHVKDIIKTREALRRSVLENSHAFNISLATPRLITMEKQT